MDWEQLLNSGRFRQTTSPGDHREEFERDYDRCVFSTPVKRLQDKAQVFPLEPHDAVRTRLTHSLEVASVAKGLVRKVVKEHLRRVAGFSDEMGRGLEAIAATCGLIHDLGNPPFGHSGEYAIQDWFRERYGADRLNRDFGVREDCEQLAADFLKFEGNAQTLRIVCRLQVLADQYGLNLTYGTLSALCKYTAASHQVSPDDHAKSKPGYFASESERVQTVRGQTGTGNARNPLTFLVEAADDIVYSVADIEDAVKKRVLPWVRVETLLQEDGSSSEAVAGIFRGKDTTLRSAIGPLADDVHASAFRTAAVRYLVHTAANSFTEKYDEIMAGTYRGELLNAEPDGKALVDALKQIAREHVYVEQSVLKLELMGKRIIWDLLDIFHDGLKNLTVDEVIAPKPKKFPGKVVALMSANYRSVFSSDASAGDPALPEAYYRLRLLTDYICGMTDSFAKRLHAELTNA